MYLPRLKLPLTLATSLCLAVFACGDGETPNEGSEVNNLSVSAHVAENHCMEKAPEDDAPVAYCKTLKDGTTHRVSLLPSTYIQDPETCVVTVVEDGMKVTLLEMEFLPCDGVDEATI